MNKFFITFNNGLLDVCINELKEHSIIPLKKSKTYIIFQTSLEKAAFLAFNLRSINRLAFLISENDFSTLEDFKKLKVEIPENFKKYSFRVSCERLGNQDFKSLDVEKIVGEVLTKKISSKVDMTNYEANYFLFIYEANYLLGIDFSEDTSLREYKIFTNRNSLKGPVAFTACSLSKFGKNKTLLNVEGGSGEIAIEALLWSIGKSPRHYQELPYSRFGLKSKNPTGFSSEVYYIDSLLANFKSCQKNAKIAGIKLKASKIDISWLDVKFDKEFFDCIIWNCRKSEVLNKNLAKEFEEFFYQCDFILKKKGKILIINRSKDIVIASAKKKNFKLDSEFKIYSGKQEDYFLIFKK